MSVVLKILSGVQSGVEVSLVDGEYSLGSGHDDDIQLIDVALKQGHARLRISEGKIALAGGKGSLKTENGTTLSQSGDWQEIEPLDVVVAGTMRFALGLPSANWASIAEEDGREEEPDAKNKKPPSRDTTSATSAMSVRAVRRYALPVGGAFALIAIAALYFSPGLAQRGPSTTASVVEELDLARQAVKQFPFSDQVEVRQEVDGTIYVVGYVDSSVERRAIQGAVNESEVPARIRIRVIEVIRSEVANLIAAEGANVTFSLTDKGELTLDGLILDKQAADNLVQLVKERVLGIATIRSRIRTAESLLADVKNLAKLSQVDTFVLLRLDEKRIEATGLVPTEKIDAWVGFLQAYAKRFSSDIALRSFVQLQDATYAGDVNPQTGSDLQGGIVIGRADSSEDVSLDLERLSQGEFELGDVFVNPLYGSGTAALPAAPSDDGKTSPPRPTISEMIASVPETAAADSSPPSRHVPDSAGDAQGIPAGQSGPSAIKKAGDGGERVVATESVLPAAASSGKRGGMEGASATASTASPDRPTALAAPADEADEKGGGLASATGSEGDTARRESKNRPATASAGKAGSDATPAAVSPAAAGKAGNSMPAERVTDGGVMASGKAQTDAKVEKASIDLKAAPEDGQANRPAPVSAAAGKGPPVVAQGPIDDAPAPEESPLEKMAQDAVRQWREGVLNSGAKGQALGRALEKLEIEKPDGRLASLLAFRRSAGAAADQPCWPGSALTAKNVTGVLFWLDVLSASDEVSLLSFDKSEQFLLLEAALNPRGVGDCARGVRPQSDGSPPSLYLEEINRNPDFVRFITRDLKPFEIEIAGASVSQDRYIQTKTGSKMREGAAPDGTSRVAFVGELGVGVQREDGLSAVVFGSGISWLMQ